MSPAWHSRVASVPKNTLVIAGETISVRFDTDSEAARPNPDTGEVELQLDARMSDPSILPAAITPGAVTIATVNGVEYLLRLVGSIDTRIQAAVKVTGEKIRFAAIELQAWTRTRSTKTGETATGAPIVTIADTAIKAHFQWLTERSKQDYRADAAAILLTPTGEAQAGDILVHGTYGRFIALDGAPTPLGSHDRIEVKRA
jgi:hypothetical protein